MIYPFLKSRYLQLFLALLAGGILPLAFAPFNLFFLAPLCPIVLALLWQHASKKFAFSSGFCFGLGLFGVGTSWIFVSINEFSHTPVAIAVLITILFVMTLAFLVGMQGWFYSALIKRQSYFILLLAFPSLWILFEWVRSWFFTGFPWLFVGYSQIDTPLAGFAPVIGVYGLSWLCVFAGVLILSYFLYPARYRLTTFLLLTIFLGGVGLKTISWTHTTGEPVRVALLQGNIDQDLKWSAHTQSFIIDRYQHMSDQAKDAELIVWPEAALPIALPMAQGLLERFRAQMQARNQNALIGVPVETPDERFYNAIVAIGANADGLYYKRHLVPFGEFVPLEKQLRGMIGLFDLPMSYGIAGPKQQDLLHAGALRFSSLICYEVVYPSLSLSSLDDANILLTISNDSWFGKSLGPHQHFQMARMRALELGRYLVRSTNNGITALVDHKGQVTQQVPQFINTILIGDVFATTGRTPLVFLTHYFVLILSGLLLMSAAGLSRRLVHKESNDVKHL